MARFKSTFRTQRSFIHDERFFVCAQICALLLIVAGVTAAQENGASKTVVLTGLGIGETLADFSLTDLDDKPARSLN